MFYVCIPGPPVGAGRPRATYVPALGRPRLYQPEKSRSWQATAATCIADRWGSRAPLDEPVKLVAQFIVARPKSLLRRKDPDGRLWCGKKPDVDNALALSMNALVNAGVIRDDALVVSVNAECLYARRDEGPSVRLWLEPVGELTACDGEPLVLMGGR